MSKNEKKKKKKEEYATCSYCQFKILISYIQKQYLQCPDCELECPNCGIKFSLQDLRKYGNSTLSKIDIDKVLDVLREGKPVSELNKLLDNNEKEHVEEKEDERGK